MKRVYDEKLKTWFVEPDCVDEWLWQMWAVGVDCDGHNTIESLKHLVDELVKMSKEARKCLKENKLFPSEEKVGGIDKSKRIN